MNAIDTNIVTEAPVLFEERAADNGKRIGFATLNAAKTLNGLSLEMARLLDGQLHAWADDAGIAMVVLQGAGEKAFCAGGDLHSLYHSMLDYREAGSRDVRDNAYASNFFSVEYRLDYRIHTYPKPVLCWGHGIVMGGGIGLMSGASHRVVTERSKLAFPEITVGLYPDVGGSWLLRRVQGRAGLFLALTGAPLNASDAIYADLADCHIEHARRDEVFCRLMEAPWSSDAADNADVLTQLLHRFTAAVEPGPLQQHHKQVEAMCAWDDLDEIVGALRVMATDDPWLTTARETFAAGSPGSARLAYELQKRATSLGLADVFRLEYIASLHCAAHGDFAEGIRALLVDRDRQPHWNPVSISGATSAWAQPFFEAPWPADEHPLANLGNEHHGAGHS